MTHSLDRQKIKDQAETIRRLQSELKEKSDFCFRLMTFIMDELQQTQIVNCPTIQPTIPPNTSRPLEPWCQLGSINKEIK